MSRRSREKGKEGEREAAALLREVWGISARRGRQFKDDPTAPDLETNVQPSRCEVKWRKALSVEGALKEAADAAEEGAVPWALTRRDRGRWIVSLYAEDFPRFVEAYIQALSGGGSA